MKTKTAIIAALCVATGALMASDADAGKARRDRNKDNGQTGEKRTEMPAMYTKAQRLDRDPSMSFHRGTLRRDGQTGWMVGDLELQLRQDATVLGPDGQEAALQEGRVAIVMGPRFGETMVGWNVRMLEPEMPSSQSRSDVVKEPSDTSPEVGELVQAPR
ncbi:MAG: hypothetical protein IPK64_18325 [bacterium]|nr:hypothetical protein [bacterium]